MDITNYTLTQDEIFKVNEAQLYLKKAFDIVKELEQKKMLNPHILRKDDPVQWLFDTKGLMMSANNCFENCLNANRYIAIHLRGISGLFQIQDSNENH